MMTTVIKRNSFIFKTPPPPDVAYYIQRYSWEKLKAVTWAEILDQRRKHQASRLHSIRASESIRAVRIHVRYFDQDIYGGWQTYVDGIGFSHWTFRHGYNIENQLMDVFPVLQPTLFPRRNAWQEWMKEFASTYQRGTFDRKPRGVAYAWALVTDGNYVEEILKEIKR
jgi:hypothetical protein